MNDEKAEEIAREMLPYNNAEYHACYNSAIKAMEWKDEQFAQEKQQLIDEAWNWLTEQKGERTKEDFIKAMKGE